MNYSASQVPFAPLGNTLTVSANVSAPLGAQAPVSAGNQSVGQYRLVNSGTATVFLGVGSSAASAQTNAGTAAAIPLLSGAVEILRFSVDSYFSGQSASAVSVYVTPGQGL